VKVIVSMLATVCVVFLLVGCGSFSNEPDVEPDAPGARSPSIMVGDNIYFIAGAADKTVSSDEISEDDILGKIDSEISLNELPEENGQTNMRGLLGSPYAQYRNDIAVLKDGEWIVFEKPSRLRSRLIVILQQEYDLHIQEVNSLREEDLDMDTGRLEVHDTSYEELDRAEYIQPEHLELLEEWVEQRKKYERLFYHK